MTSGTATTRKDPRLSQAARHVVIPSGIKTTGWPAVRDTLANLGVFFDLWQQDLSKVALGKRRDGRYAAGIGGVVLSIPRQVGKTFWVGSVIFALCLLTPKIKVIWTAHHTDTADETFDAMLELTRMERFQPHVRRVLTGGGKQRIIFNNGSRIEFGAREAGFGRGKTKVSVLVLDEFQHVSEAALENLTPTANQGTNPLVFMMGTPPRPIDRGDAFKRKRQRALAGKSKDTLYVEMSADSNADLDDREQWRKANPSFPKRTPEDAFLRMRENLASDESFRREALGIWDVDTSQGKPRLSANQWSVLESDEVPAGRLAVGVKFSPDGVYAALAVGVRPDEDHVPVHVDGIRLASTSEGVGWIVRWLKDREDRVSQVVVDGKGWSPVLVKALDDEGFPVSRQASRGTSKFLRVLSTPEVIEAHAMFLDAIQDEALTHGSSPLLDEQVGDATTRKIGTAGGWGWKALTDTGNTTLLDAVTFAYWSAKTVTRGRRKGVRVL